MSYSKCKIVDVCVRVTSGGTPSRSNSDFYTGDIPWVKTQELNDCWVRDTKEHLTRTAVENSSAKLLPTNTVLMAMYGATVGKLGILGRSMTCNQACCAMVVNPKLASYRYLYYALLNSRREIVNLATGAAQQNLSARVIKELEFSFPSLEEQRAIAATLGALDDKIESNRRAVNLAQDLGDVLFEKADSSHVKLNAIAEIVMGTSPKGEFLNETGNGLPFYQGTRDFSFRFPKLRVWTTDPKRQANVNDTLLSVRAPVGDLNRASQICCIGRGIAAIRSVAFPSTLYYSMRGSTKVWEKFNGEGTVFGSVTKADVHEALIKWPKRKNLALLEKQLSIIDHRIISLDQETQHLIALRDTLLPELMSGRIRVAEAREVINAEVGS